jgi:hypothetical protein
VDRRQRLGFLLQWGREGHEPCPPDLAHTLAVTYRVRCNPFHGEKSVDPARDRGIVTAAANTLVPFVINAERALDDAEVAERNAPKPF